MDYCLQFTTMFKNVCRKCDYVEFILWGSIAYLFNITIINNLRTIKPFISINMFPRWIIELKTEIY